ncbi:MAG: CapA family protein [Smithellaceae bacterium]|nr:CapA family protein [Smithellaceae bacterium]
MKGKQTAGDRNSDISIFFCGDVMTGRDIDQVLSHPSNPIIHEPYLRNAQAYVRLVERANSPLPEAVDFSYPWDEIREEFDRHPVDLRIVNLETSVTSSDDYWRGKESTTA